MYSASPVLFLIFLLVTVVALIFTKKSNACRNIYYVGSNENAAKLSGINVDRVKIFVYVVIALLSALAGILSLARFNVATPELSKGAETTAISAAVIGGTSMTGGLGGILGTFLGIFLLKIVDSALVMMNVSVYWQDFVQGAYPGHRRYHRLYEPPKKRQQLPPAHAGPGAQETCPAAVIRDPAPGAGAGNTAKKNKRRNPQ